MCQWLPLSKHDCRVCFACSRYQAKAGNFFSNGYELIREANTKRWGVVFDEQPDIRIVRSFSSFNDHLNNVLDNMFEEWLAKQILE